MCSFSLSQITTEMKVPQHDNSRKARLAGNTSEAPETPLEPPGLQGQDAAPWPGTQVLHVVEPAPLPEVSLAITPHPVRTCARPSPGPASTPPVVSSPDALPADFQTLLLFLKVLKHYTGSTCSL